MSVAAADWPSDPCRDESCPREELHAAHAAVPLRGRTPKACPRCLSSLVGLGGRCRSCDWSRASVAAEVVDVESFDSRRYDAGPIAPWVLCPSCGGKGDCSWCDTTGYVPRVRAVKMRLLLGGRGR